MAIKYASKEIDLSKLDYNKVKELRKHDKLLKSLDKWILFADRELTGDILELSTIVNKLYNLTNNITVYRGIREGHNVSANLGLKNPILNKHYKYSSDIESISFTTDICIARAFGNIVVKSQFNNKKNKYLTVTDELSYIIDNDFRNIKNNIETQDEIILLPSFDIDFTVLEIDKKPLWGMW